LNQPRGQLLFNPPPISINKGPHSIYFAWDSVEIDSAAQQAIDTAVVESGKATEITIKVDGYADRSGPEYYNDNLSLRRAEVVKSMLITKGIDASAIIIQGHGERAYEVETADGVKERRNRRVVIMLR
jgi:OmpA-OmpF porin, OOP family